MKKMYEEGDDEMKRTISKAFTESREKSMKGETGLDGFQTQTDIQSKKQKKLNKEILAYYFN